MPFIRIRFAVLLFALLFARAAVAADCPSTAIRAGGGQPPGSPPPSGLPAPPISPTMNTEAMSTALDGYLADLSAKENFSGTVLVAKAGEPVFERGYGEANRAAKTPNMPGTRFNVGSIGKAFTHVAICQLIAKGKLEATDTIGDLLPDYPNTQARAATVEQLLTHTAGIANFFGPEFEAAEKKRFQSNDDYFRFVAPLPLTAAPGAQQMYCNGCYVVLGAIVARVSGMPYETYITENVFKPAGMTGAGFASVGDKDVATGYERNPVNGSLENTSNRHGERGSGAGGSYARVRDLLAFDNAVREFRLLSRPMTGSFLHAPPDATATGARVADRFTVAGGAPGINAMIQSTGAWTVIVEGNWSPPNAQRLAQEIMRQLVP
jgi:D-alanyl-D-alanine carboxypeptidase